MGSPIPGRTLTGNDLPGKSLQKFSDFSVLMLAVIAMSASAHAADIYRSQAPNGAFHYASQPLDASYVLYLKGESDTAQPAAKPGQASARTAKFEPIIRELAQKHGVEAALVHAIIEVESRSDANAISPKGAVGMMQLMPATATRYGVRNRTDPLQNIEGGIRYLKDLLKRHDGNIALALASYNAGEGTIANHNRRIPPYKETMLYVPAVLAKLQAIRNQGIR